MPSQLKLLMQARKNNTFQQVDRGIKRRIALRASRNSNKSPTGGDIERITDDYIKQRYLNNIVSKKTAKEAMDSLQYDSLRGNSGDFSNFISGVGRKTFIESLYNRFAQDNLQRITESRVITKSGRDIGGARFNNKIYLRVTKAGLRAFRFKDNRFSKIPKNISMMWKKRNNKKL